MDKIIIDRCCGNCEWSISPSDEVAIMKENNYDEDDITRPRAGDCCLSVEHNGKYVCSNHDYLSSGLKVYAFYEEKDLGPGYYVVNTYYDHVIKFFKLYRTGKYGEYCYGIRAYDLYPINNEMVNGISFEIGKIYNELLYNVITIFANNIDNNIIWSADKNNFISVNTYEHSTCLYFNGSIDNNFIDIKINYDKNNKNYKLIQLLFRNLAAITANMKNEEVAKKVRKLSR